MKVDIRFFEPGKWQDKPWEDPFDVEKGEVRSVSVELAHVVTDAGRGEVVHDSSKEGVSGPEPEVIKTAEDFELDGIGLPDALVKKLKENEVTTVKKLTEMTPEQVLDLNGIGQGKVDDIAKALAEIKLSFAEGEK